MTSNVASSTVGLQTIAAAAGKAPSQAGVYCLLGEDHDLLYVGKAANLRRRLRDHARKEARGRRAIATRIREVRWIECANEREAQCREADIVVGLAPPLNRVMAKDAFIFVNLDVVPTESSADIRFRLAESAVTDCTWTFGAFPHLGKGKISWRAVRTNAGYSALLRLLWVSSTNTEERARLPAKLRGSSPPLDHRGSFSSGPLPMLRDFLSGRSQRILTLFQTTIASEDVPVFMRGPLERDLEAAKEFYELGPRALRALRLRHGLPAGAVDGETLSALISSDLRKDIGDFVLPRD